MINLLAEIMKRPLPKKGSQAKLFIIPLALLLALIASIIFRFWRRLKGPRTGNTKFTNLADLYATESLILKLKSTGESLIIVNYQTCYAFATYFDRCFVRPYTIR